MVDWNGGRLPGFARGRPRKYQLKHLTEEHKEIIGLSVLGVTPTELCRRFDRHPTGISLILNSEISKTYAASLRKEREAQIMDARDIIESSQVPAAEALVSSIDDKSVPYSEKFKNCRYLLDAGGNGPRNVQVADGAYTRERVNEVIAETLLAAREKLQIVWKDHRKTECEEADLVEVEIEESVPAFAGMER